MSDDRQPLMASAPTGQAVPAPAPPVVDPNATYAYNPEATAPAPYPMYQDPNAPVGYQQGPPPVMATTTVYAVSGGPPASGCAHYSCHPTQVRCDHCGHVGMTRVEYETGVMTWLFAGGLCLLGCWPCAPIPFCVDDTKDAVHHCSHCGAHVGVKHRM